MIPIYICEDNEAQRQKFELLVTTHIMIENLDMYIAKSTGKPNEVLDAVRDNQGLGIYFFDIELHDLNLNGFELAKEIRTIDNNGYIIFITTHEELAFQTFQYKVAALDYILKDDPLKLKESVRECFTTIQSQLSGKNKHEKIIKVVSDAKVLFLDEEEITYFESVGAHKIIAHGINKRIQFNGNLKKIEQDLSENFFRCHRSYVVNMNYVESIDKKNNLVNIKNGDYCYLSRRKEKIFLNKLEQ